MSDYLDPTNCSLCIQVLRMATTDPSFRNLIQFVPQRSTADNNGAETNKSSQVHSRVSGEDIKTFYESLINADINSHDASSGVPPSVSSAKLSPKEKKKKKTRLHDRKSKGSVASHSHSLHRKTEYEKVEAKHTETHTSECAPGPSDQTFKELKPKERQHFKLLQAAQIGDMKQIAKLLEQGVDINYKDFYGWTALMCAAKEGHSDTVSFLLQHGSDRAFTDSSGKTALSLAQSAGHHNIVEELASTSHSCRTLGNDERDTSSCSTSKYFCQKCKLEFSVSEKKKHETSTVHLFNCGHKPKGPAYLIPETNRGFQMLLRTGWEVDKGLGPRGEGAKYPIKTVLKKDRKCLGGDDSDKKKAKITHFSSNDQSAVAHNSIPIRKISARKAARNSRKATEKREKRHEQRLRFELSGGFE